MKLSTVSVLLGGSAGVAALKIDPNNPNSYKDAAKTVAKNLLSYYHGTEAGQIPGLLPGPPPGGDYYWWESGAMWDTLIDYWHYTGDAAYNNLVAQGLLFQVGPNDDYLTPNQTATLGNDDQGIWGMAAMSAAEANLANPSNSSKQQWSALATSVFDELSQDRWDEATCRGGLRWQILSSNQGYNYKNSISTGVLFNLGARLARFTQNSTYADWAGKAWDWAESVGFIDKWGYIYDGAHVEFNCTDINKVEFSYVAGIYLQGAAFMYNYTNGSQVWQDRLSNVLTATLDVFMDNGVPVETACETQDKILCTADMLSLKSILLRTLASTAKMAPFTAQKIAPLLEKSAVAAAASCEDGGACGFRWTTGQYDGTKGAGQQMNAVAAFSVVFLDQVTAPGTSNGTATQGGGGSGSGSGTGSGSGNSTGTGGGNSTATGKPSGSGAVRGSSSAGMLVLSVVLAGFFTALMI